jgi:uncharacterized protein Yka (UPF0111/DUF47 family)
MGLLGVATIFVSGWIKSSNLAELKKYAQDEIECLRKDINQLWDKVSKVEVLSSKIETVEKGIDRIEKLLLERR